MKKRSFLLLILVFLLIHLSYNQTIIPGGEVFGNWIKSASPYLIEGEINIPLDKTLAIEAGVEVKFNGHFKFIIYGCLLAEGAPGDSIKFTTNDKETGWHSLRFTNTEANSQPVSKVSYCIVEYGKSYGTCPDNSGGGIYIGHSIPVISNSTIRNNSAVSGAGDWGGGGIYSEYSRPEIYDNLITGNYSGHDGGGIYCGYNSPSISNNQIINNEAASRGGGIASFTFASPDIIGNEIAENQANSIGGGIYQSGGNSLIQSNIIRNNYAGDGGGIACYLSNSKIYNNLINENEAYRGAGLWNQGSSPNVFNNTIINNTAYTSGGANINMAGMAGVIVYSNPLIVNNILFLNIAEEGLQIYSNPDNIPVLWHNDIEGLSNGGIFGSFDEQEGNIDITPDFDTEGEHDCALSENSECIDNGINGVSGFNLPETDILGNQRIWDGDNDGQPYADMGAYEYGSSPVGMNDDRMFLSSMNVTIFPNPLIISTTIEYELKQPETVRITFYNQFGKQVDVIEENQQKGLNKVMWTPENLADGIYYFRISTGKLQADEQVASGKVIVMR